MGNRSRLPSLGIEALYTTTIAVGNRCAVAHVAHWITNGSDSLIMDRPEDMGAKLRLEMQNHGGPPAGAGSTTDTVPVRPILALKTH